MRAFIVTIVLGLSGCGGCTGGPAPVDTDGPVRLVEPEAEPGASTGSPAYREAYDRAAEEITIENARERLDTLNREIEEDLKR